MRRLILSFCILILITGCASAFSGGSGTSGDPWQISDVYELQDIGDNATTLAAHYVLINDIDASDTSGWDSGAGFVPIGNTTVYFTGSFDGMGYTISDLMIYRPSTTDVGLFGRSYGTITNVSVFGNVTGDYNCAILLGIGPVTQSTVSKIHASGIVNGYQNVAGVVGYNRGSISNSYSTANVTSTTDNVAGIAGTNEGSSSTITNSYAIGPVTGLSGPDVSGIAGRVISGTATACYWDIDTTGQISGNMGTGKTTAEMLLLSTYTSWDFDTIWTMQPYVNNGYPTLFENYTYTEPSIISPENNSVLDVTYPPLQTDITFKWFSHSAAASSSYTLARDPSYSLVIASGTTTTFEKPISIAADTYYFRVRYNWDNGTSSEYNESTFSINTDSTVSYGTAVHGVIYEIVSNSQTPISNAIVTVYNDTFSSTYTTSTDGYYYFQNLTNSTYYIRAYKNGYNTNDLNIVTIPLNETVIKNIVLDKETAPNYITPHYVQFVVKSLNQYYEGVTITIYEGDSATALYTLTTGSDGAAGAELSETIKYRITAYKEGVIDTTTTVYPTDTKYTFYVGISDIINDILNPDRNSQEATAIEINVTKHVITENSANITVDYLDYMDETSNLTFTISQSIENDPGNVTVIDTVSLGTASDTSYNFTITGYDGEAYYVLIEATHETFGDVDRLYGVQFENTSSRFGFAVEVIGWLAVILLVIVALTASPATVPQTAVGVCCLAIIMKIFMDWGYYISGPGLILALVISIAANFAIGKEAA